MKYTLLIFLLAFTSMTGCTSMQSLESDQTKIKEQLEVGDRLLISEKDGRTVDMVLESVEGDVLMGVLSDDRGKAVSVNLSDVEAIEKEAIDGTRTAVAAAGGAGLAYILLVSAVLLAW